MSNSQVKRGAMTMAQAALLNLMQTSSHSNQGASAKIQETVNYLERHKRNNRDGLGGSGQVWTGHTFADRLRWRSRMTCVGSTLRLRMSTRGRVRTCTSGKAA